MQNVRQDAAQDGIKIPRRNINNLRYADHTTLLAENEEELKSLLMRVKRRLKETQHRKLRSWHLVPSFHTRQIEGKKWKQSQILLSWAPKINVDITTSKKLKDTCSLEGKL